ncbi:formin isoform X2 [Nematostella vectensis]|uniref:formin isoform X2 n=1 Tax=Nematostella vectensis TaxID=45351 RepID=UPI00207798B2|nr:formin isoform X2 [Nematostella vectensis]
MQCSYGAGVKQTSVVNGQNSPNTPPCSPSRNVNKPTNKHFSLVKPPPLPPPPAESVLHPTAPSVVQKTDTSLGQSYLSKLSSPQKKPLEDLVAVECAEPSSKLSSSATPHEKSSSIPVLLTTADEQTRTTTSQEQEKLKKVPPPPPPLPVIEGSSLSVPPPPPPPPPPLLSGTLPMPPPPPPPPPGCAGLPPPPPSPQPGCAGLPPPPPPPPPGCAGLPPPPPPIDVPMKPLFWKRIQLKKPQPEPYTTLWENLIEPDINTSEFAKCFSKVERKKEGKLVSSNSMSKLKQKVVHLLESKRSQGIGILLSSLHANLDEIKDSLYKMDTSVIDYENLKALYENRGTKEELSTIEQYLEDNPDAILDRPEQFLLDVSKIVCYEERLACLIARTTVRDGLEEIGQMLTNFRLVCEELQKGKNVHNIMGLILAFGNFMNGGNIARGQADGFDLEIIPKLKDVKSRNNTSNLLCYLVQEYVMIFDKDAGTLSAKFPLPEPADLQSASQVSFDDVQADLRNIEKKIESCDVMVTRVLRESDANLVQPFKKIMNKFLVENRNELKEQIQALEDCQKRFSVLLPFFYNQLPTLTAQEFFDIWVKFTSDFKVIWKKEQQRISKQLYEKTKKKLKEKQVENISKKPISISGLKLKIAYKKGK